MRKRLVSILLLLTMLVNTSVYANKVVEIEESAKQEIVETKENNLELKNESEKNILKEDINKILNDLEEQIVETKNLKLTEDEEKLNALKKQLDEDLSLEELENLKEEVRLFKTEIVEKLNDLDSKNSDSIVYIVTDQDETSTKEKYESEFGDVEVVNDIENIFKEENISSMENKNLTIISEIDLIKKKI